jgi:hypothetical protein
MEGKEKEECREQGLVGKESLACGNYMTAEISKTGL